MMKPYVMLSLHALGLNLSDSFVLKAITKVVQKAILPNNKFKLAYFEKRYMST